MGTLIKTLNEAEAVVQLSREGAITPLEVIERLVDLGFCDVELTEPNFVGWFDGIRFNFHYGKSLPVTVAAPVPDETVAKPIKVTIADQLANISNQLDQLMILMRERG